MGTGRKEQSQENQTLQERENAPWQSVPYEIRTPTFRTPVSHVSLSGKAWLSQSHMEPPPSLGHLCSVTLPVISTESFPTQLPWLLTALRAVLCAGPVLGLYIGA